jgi:hypothetical protein
MMAQRRVFGAVAGALLISTSAAHAQDKKPTPAEGTERQDGAHEQTVAAPKAAKPGAPAQRGQTAQGQPKVQTEESKEGVKTYKFGAVEVEGRLRSPQILYFLRRVRAEFDAGDLGHRSFLLELADTQRDSAFR